MADVHRADVLVRWVGLLPFLRGPAAPEQRTAPDTPWQTGRRRPTRTTPAEPATPADLTPRPKPTDAATPAESEPTESAAPGSADRTGPTESSTPAARPEPDAAVEGPDAAERSEPAPPTEHPEHPDPLERARSTEQQPPPLRLPVPGPPPVPAEAHALDLGRATPDPEPAPLVDPLLFRAFARSPTALPAPPRDRRRGAVVDGIEHRPPVRPDPHIVGLSRRLRGRVGSRAFTLVFVGIYLLILVQLIVALMNS